MPDKKVNCFKCKFFSVSEAMRDRGRDIYQCNKGHWKTIYRLRDDHSETYGEKPQGECIDFKEKRT